MKHLISIRCFANPNQGPSHFSPGFQNSYEYMSYCPSYEDYHDEQENNYGFPSQGCFFIYL
jgi:hypothetical protein